MEVGARCTFSLFFVSAFCGVVYVGAGSGGGCGSFNSHLDLVVCGRGVSGVRLTGTVFISPSAVDKCHANHHSPAITSLTTVIRVLGISTSCLVKADRVAAEPSAARGGD